jgi:zinc transport system ATP-binding protein
MSSTVIRFKDVYFGYNQLCVLENINFSIEKGEFVGIIGPNGGGKTTLLKLMLGILKPRSGALDVFGSDPRRAGSRVSYVPQASTFDRQFPISVYDLVLSGRLSRLPWHGRYRKTDKEAAQQALKTVKLENLQHRSFGTLSTGQAQRALIARALAANPEILLLDEPTASIDPETSEDVLRILTKLTPDITVVMVTHNLRAVIHDAQKVLSVQKGVAVMAPEQVCQHFAYGVYHPPLIQGAGH